MEGWVQLEAHRHAKRRQFTPEFKVRLVLDVLTGVQSQAEACRKHALGPNLLGSGRPPSWSGRTLVFETEAPESAEQARIAELEQVLGRMTLENEILKKASSRLGSLSTRSEK